MILEMTVLVTNSWNVYKRVVLSLAVAIMAVVAFVWLGYEFFRFLWQPDRIGSRSIHPGAIDLRILHDLVTRWFRGIPIYTGVKSSLAVHPPATYAILWPIYGWTGVKTTMFVWTTTAVAALGWLIFLVVWESCASSFLERTFMALMPLAIYPTGAIIGNGQIVIHIIPMTIAGLLLICSGAGGWTRDLLGSFLFLAALAKPIIAAPFFWIIIFSAGSFRPAGLICTGYMVLTLFAATFQDAGFVSLFQQWMTNASYLGVSAGEANLHILLGYLGLQVCLLPASFLLLCLLGFWVYRYRHCDIWLLMGVAALIARFWSYHRWYDDLLILLPMITLFRIAKSDFSARGMDLLAGLLLGITLFFMLAPGGLYLLPPPWNMRYVGAQVVIWIVNLIFLMVYAHRKTEEVKGT
jgi:hypothetical protein